MNTVLRLKLIMAIQEVEGCKDENETNNLKIETKNSLETHGITMRSTSIVEEMKSKFEVGHKKKKAQEFVHARKRLDENQWKNKHKFEVKQKGPQHPQDVQERADLTNQRQGPAIHELTENGRSTESAVH